MTDLYKLFQLHLVLIQSLICGVNMCLSLCVCVRVLPITTKLKIKLVYSGHSIPFGAYNELLKGFINWISRSVCPLMFYVFSIFLDFFSSVSSAINEIYI